IAPNGGLYAGTLTGKVAALENSYSRTVACAKGSADGSGGRRSNLRRYRESDLIKLDILINGDSVEPLAMIVHRDK
ncbi:hypothetical protein S83_064424, partial [Arachis hypogaea]